MQRGDRGAAGHEKRGSTHARRDFASLLVLLPPPVRGFAWAFPPGLKPGAWLEVAGTRLSATLCMLARLANI